MSKFGNKMKKRSFLSDLKKAIKTIPRAMKEGPLAHAKKEAGAFAKYLKNKRKKKK